jgi:phosphatidylglycerophosphatase A
MKPVPTNAIRTDASMTPTAEAGAPKPQLAFAIATGLGLGYLPKAPGTWGSLGGVLLAAAALISTGWKFGTPFANTAEVAARFVWADCLLVVVISIAGVWASGRVASSIGRKDPQIAVVDEIAGQLICYLGLGISRTFSASWKYLLLGFILFRVFDIWKPFPARQAENLPGGLGIMADDWIAGVYGALVLGLVRRLGF